MLDKDIDQFDDDENDIDFGDDEAEPIVEEPRKDEPEPEKRDDSAEELAALRKERDDLKAEKERLADERDEFDFKAKEATYHNANNYITRCKSDVKKEGDLLADLEGQLEEARINGDADKAKSLTRSINEKRTLIGNINGEITKYSPLLVKPEKGVKRVEAKAEKKEVNPILEMARNWESENAWYNNPKFAAKRDFIENLAKERAAKYDASKISFWTYIDSEAEAFDAKQKEPEKQQRRTPPAVRPISNNGGSKQLTNKNKADADILAVTRQMLARRGIDKDHPNFKAIQKSYYITAKEHAAKEKANG